MNGMLLEQLDTGLYFISVNALPEDVVDPEDVSPEEDVALMHWKLETRNSSNSSKETQSLSRIAGLKTDADLDVVLTAADAEVVIDYSGPWHWLFYSYLCWCCPSSNDSNTETSPDDGSK